MTTAKTTDTEGSLVAVLSTLSGKLGTLDGKVQGGMETLAQGIANVERMIASAETRRAEDRQENRADFDEVHKALASHDERITALEEQAIRKAATSDGRVKRWTVRRDVATALGAAVTAVGGAAAIIAELTGHWPF